jgi:hypothetical protein
MIAIYFLVYVLAAVLTTFLWLVVVRPAQEQDAVMCLLMGVIWPVGLGLGVAATVVWAIGLLGECLYRKGWLSSPFKRRKY